MKTEVKDLWNCNSEVYDENVKITAYFPDEKRSNMGIIIFAGGGYGARSEHEGKDYAEFLANNGYTAFVVDYRVAPNKFPLPLLDARRAIKMVRYDAKKYRIDKNRIAVMGSSAGGHLAALSSTYFNAIEFEGADEIEKEDYVPDFQILCYPVISLFGKDISHLGSGINLLGEKFAELCEELSPHLIASSKTPPAFIWHSFGDNLVNVKNSLMYAERLKDYDVRTELHIFPDGNHGTGLTNGDDKISIHVSQWQQLLLNWLNYME